MPKAKKRNKVNLRVSQETLNFLKTSVEYGLGETVEEVVIHILRQHIFDTAVRFASIKAAELKRK